MLRTTPAEAAPSLRPHLRLALVTGLASLLDSAAIVAVGLGLPLWRTELGLGVWQVGAVSASLTVAIAVGALVGGRLADLLGRHRVFPATVLLCTAGAATVALAPDADALVVGVVVLGLASGADLPASLALLSERVPAEVRGRLVASTHVLWTAGVVLTTGAGFVVSDLGTAGVRGVFAVLALVALVTALLRSSYRPTALPAPGLPAAATGRGGVALRTFVTDRSLLVPLLLTGAYYLLYTLVASTFGGFKTYVLVVVVGASQSVATGLSFLTGLVGLAGVVVFAALADSRWRARLYPAGIAGYVVALGLLAVTGGAALPVVVVALVLQNASFPFVGDSISKVWTQELFPTEARATAQGATIAVARLGAGGFALVTPALLERSPGALFALLLAVVLAVGALGGRLLARTRLDPPGGSTRG